MKMTVRNFMYALISVLVVFIVFNLVIPLTVRRDGFEPALEYQMSGVGEIVDGRTEGEIAVNSANSPSAAIPDALLA